MGQKNKLSFTICSEDGGGYSAQCIEFPGIITQAETKTELREMISDAVNGYFESFPEERDRLQRIKKNKVIEIRALVDSGDLITKIYHQGYVQNKLHGLRPTLTNT